MLFHARHDQGAVIGINDNIRFTLDQDIGGVPIVPNGFSGDESVNGTWTLTVRDAVDNDNNGSVQSWNVEIMSRFD